MARIVTPVRLTRDFKKQYPSLCFYEMEGACHVRTRSSLTRKRVLQDPAFLLTRVHADFMKVASPLAAGVLATIPVQCRVKGISKKMVSAAIRALKQGMNVTEVRDSLVREFVPVMEKIDRTVGRQARGIRRLKFRRKRVPGGYILEKKCFKVPADRFRKQVFSLNLVCNETTERGGLMWVKKGKDRLFFLVKDEHT